MKSWLRLFRAQTAPATILLVLVPYCYGKTVFSWDVLILGVLALFIHWFSFGHNSLMDTAMLYDVWDPSKKHHPLVTGKIRLHTAHRVIHWGLCLLTVTSVAFTLYCGVNKLMALASLCLWVTFGVAYNCGLSKEDPLGFLSISVCFTSAGTWGWFLSHETLGMVGVLYLCYVFFTILFQISWSGHLKDLLTGERSNILREMGAEIDRYNDELYFNPGYSRYYGLAVKHFNLLFGALLLVELFSVPGLISLLFFGAIAYVYLIKLTVGRKYVRSRELLNMSIEEIATIYLPIAIMLPLLDAIVLMTFGVLYFFLVNVAIWGVPYPKV